MNALNVNISDTIKPFKADPVDVSELTCSIAADTFRSLAEETLSQGRPYIIAFTQDTGDTASFYDEESLNGLLISNPENPQDAQSRHTLVKVSLFGLLNLNENFKYIYSFALPAKDRLTLRSWLCEDKIPSLEIDDFRKLQSFESFFEQAASHNFCRAHYKLALIYFSNQKGGKALSTLLQGVEKGKIQLDETLFLYFFNVMGKLKEIEDLQAIDRFVIRLILDLFKLIQEGKIDLKDETHQHFVERFFLSILYSNHPIQFMNEGVVEPQLKTALTQLAERGIAFATLLLARILEREDLSQAALKHFQFLTLSPKLEKWFEKTDHLHTFNIPCRLYYFILKIGRPFPKFREFLRVLKENVQKEPTDENQLLLALVSKHTSDKDAIAQLVPDNMTSFNQSIANALKSLAKFKIRMSPTPPSLFGVDFREFVNESLGLQF